MIYNTHIAYYQVNLKMDHIPIFHFIVLVSGCNSE